MDGHAAQERDVVRVRGVARVGQDDLVARVEQRAEQQQHRGRGPLGHHDVRGIHGHAVACVVVVCHGVAQVRQTERLCVARLPVLHRRPPRHGRRPRAWEDRGRRSRAERCRAPTPPAPSPGRPRPSPRTGGWCELGRTRRGARGSRGSPLGQSRSVGRLERRAEHFEAPKSAKPNLGGGDRLRAGRPVERETELLGMLPQLGAG